MNTIQAKQNALEHAFWAKYPSLEEKSQYTFQELFPALASDEYESVFWDMVDLLPLIPVIPVQSGETVTHVALDHH